MIKLGANLGVVGIENNYQPCYKLTEGNQTELIEGGFCNFPSDYSYSDDGIESYLYEPWVVSNQIQFVGFQEFTLSPNKKYSINGYAGQGAEDVFITMNVLDDEDFTQRFSYSTKAVDGFYSFNFTKEELNLQQNTQACVWVLNTNYKEARIFSATVTFTEEKTILIFNEGNPPQKSDTSGSRLTIQGAFSNIGPRIYGVFIYNDEDLSAEELEQQNTIKEGFNTLDSGVLLEGEEGERFLQALGARSENNMLTPSTGTAYTFVLTQRTIEQELHPNHFYIWSQITAEDVPNGEITITKTTWSKVCLDGNTQILMADGSSKALMNLIPGERVMDINGGSTMVLDVKRDTYSSYYTAYQFEKDVEIIETQRHRFYNFEDGYYKNLQDWKIGEHAVNFRNEKIKLLSKKRVNKRTENFGLITESGRYYANTLLSGLMRCNKEFFKEKDTDRMLKIINSISSSESLTLVGEQML